MSTIQAAFGSAASVDLPLVGAGGGVQTEHGILLPPAGKVVAYVRSTGLSDQDNQTIAEKLVPTLAGALARCRSGEGDTIVVLPGHAENVTDATMLDNLANGTRIIGTVNPRGDNAPTFTFTATAGSWTIDQKNVFISGLRFDLTGIDAVVLGLDVTASGCCIAGNYFTAENTALQAVSVIGSSGGADYLRVSGNWFYGGVSDDVTTCIDLNGASDGNNIVIDGNVMIGGWHATRGAIRIAGAIKNLLVTGNRITQLFLGATSVTCIAVSDVASTGMIEGNRMTVQNNGVAVNQGIVFAGVTTTTMMCNENYLADEPGKSGVLSPAVVAT